MKIIVGLGNPGTEYTLTRHNAGFLAIDSYLENKAPISCSSKFQAEIAELHYEGGIKILFVKPQTFMNNSGSAVAQLINFYKVDISNLLLIHDEIDLRIGSIKLVTDSSPAGHNGVRDIFDKLNTQAISRIRIGIESREHRSEMSTDAFVLQKFSNDELKNLQENVFSKIVDQINEFIQKN